MPIGASKVGALGGLVPGGSVTFNASGTFSVPPGVKKVSITGAGGTGNPGNAGNQGNPGNPGTGGGGGGSGGSRWYTCSGNILYRSSSGNYGGHAWKTFVSPTFARSQPVACYAPYQPGIARGGTWGTICPTFNNANPGAAGGAGTSGTAGNPGNPGNPGCASSGLTKTFNGGAGGNAGTGGAAGNAGNGGGGGGGANSAPGANAAGNGGSGGTGGGNGGYGGFIQGVPPGTQSTGGQGGGGAGSVNSGQSGQAGAVLNSPFPTFPSYVDRRGGTGNVTAPLPNTGNNTFMAGITVNQDGGQGGGMYKTAGGPSLLNIPESNCRFNVPPSINSYINRQYPYTYTPGCAAPSALRAGGGGSGTCADSVAITYRFLGSGGGGGGGRGNAGGNSGPTPTPTGSAATPVTYNCVPVTPGGCYPIVVGGPSGGQVVISWNPQ